MAFPGRHEHESISTAWKRHPTSHKHECWGETNVINRYILVCVLCVGCAAQQKPINDVCPRSGKPVSSNSLTEYRGHAVGFCNTHCRDEFVANIAERPDDDTAFFDKVIAGIQAE
jgi:hypothetical protein